MKSADALTHSTAINSEIPSNDHAKSAIEDGLRSALLGLPGEWKVAIVCSRTSVWWVLRVDGPHFEWMTVLPDGTRQTAEEMTGRLLTALRSAKVLS